MRCGTQRHRQLEPWSLTDDGGRQYKAASSLYNQFPQPSYPFAGDPVCARFEHVGPARPWRGRPWVGVEPSAWRSLVTVRWAKNASYSRGSRCMGSPDKQKGGRPVKDRPPESGARGYPATWL